MIRSKKILSMNVQIDKQIKSMRKKMKRNFFRLHDQLDIQECICRYRRYCYPGAKRHYFDTSAETFMSLAPADNIISTIFYYILLICLRFAFYDHF